MKTRRKGDAVRLMCSADGCEKFYADVLSDRVMVYSRHYETPHSTAILLDQFSEISLYAFDKTYSDHVPAELRCACDRFPCLTIEPDRITLTATHRVNHGNRRIAETHENIWGIKEIAEIGALMGLTYGTIPFDSEGLEKVS